MLYLPAVTPREKYSPFLLVLRVNFWPFSRLLKTTTASGMGFPSLSRQTPLTVPENWAKPRGTQSPSIKRTKTRLAKRFFILASRRETSLRLEEPSALIGNQLGLAISTDIQQSGIQQFFLCIRNWIPGSRRRERPQTQHAAITEAACPILATVT